MVVRRRRTVLPKRIGATPIRASRKRRKMKIVGPADKEERGSLDVVDVGVARLVWDGGGWMRFTNW